ncbi:hypothetical protein [Nocardia sp. CA-290969]|uniref:hypothetical protein n=1 Tax=Nocardia sp. CA-290969 TaxID=3239986 RepID=UPI003D900D50
METYLGLKGIGELLGVSPATVSKWRTRYAGTDHPCPPPAVWIDDTPGWKDRPAWQAWHLARPGRGAGGGPLPLARAREEFETTIAAVRAEYPNDRPGRSQLRALHRIAETYGVDQDVIVALANKAADDRPDTATDECDILAVATVIRSSRAATSRPS